MPLRSIAESNAAAHCVTFGQSAAAGKARIHVYNKFKADVQSPGFDQGRVLLTPLLHEIIALFQKSTSNSTPKPPQILPKWDLVIL